MSSVVLRFVLLIVCIPAVGQAQPTRAAPRLPAPSDIDPQLTEELQRVEQAFWNAAVHNDAEALDRLVASEFMLRVADLPQGSLPRAIWMTNTLNGSQAGSFEIEHSAARKLAEDLAAVSHLVKSTGTINGRDQSCVCYGLDLWKKRNGNWQIIARYNIASDRRRERGVGNRPIPPPTDVDAQLTETLRQLEQELGDLAARGFNDTKEIDRLIGSEFTLRTSDAPETSVPRALWVQPSGPYKVDSFEERYHAARKLADDLAVVSLLLTQKASGDGRDRSGDYYVVDIWRERGGRWQVIARYSGKTFDPVAR